MEKILVGVSSCLVGNNVRYNSGNCHKSYITKNYSQYFDYKVVCPEVNVGFGVPRKTMFLVENIQKDILKVKINKTNIDVTTQLQNGCNDLINKLDEKIYGFILKAKSPSCGVETARVFDIENNYTGKKADGLFVRALKKYDPLLPLEDDGKLNDFSLREHFLTRVFCYYDLCNVFMKIENISEMEKYHSKHKILLRCYNNLAKKKLGKLIANIKDKSEIENVKKQYIEIFMNAISKPLTNSHHYMALQNTLRKINKQITKPQRQYIQDILIKYKDGKVTKNVPTSIIQIYLLELDIPYLKNQSYLNPYPKSMNFIEE